MISTVPSSAPSTVAAAPADSFDRRAAKSIVIQSTGATANSYQIGMTSQSSTTGNLSPHQGDCENIMGTVEADAKYPAWQKAVATLQAIAPLRAEVARIESKLVKETAVLTQLQTQLASAQKTVTSLQAQTGNAIAQGNIPRAEQVVAAIELQVATAQGSIAIITGQLGGATARLA